MERFGLTRGLNCLCRMRCSSVGSVMRRIIAMSNQKNSNDVRRREFLKTAGLCGAALCGLSSCTATRTQNGETSPEASCTHLTIRPYQLLCIVCAIGEGGIEKCDKRLGEIVRVIRNNPDIPVTVNCNAGDVREL